MDKTTKQRAFQPKLSIVRDTFGEIREMVDHRLRGAALELITDLFFQEVERLCGPRFSRKRGERCHRGGSDPGTVVVQGQRMTVRKPRVKRDGKDVELVSYAALQDFDLLCGRVMAHMLAGVSTRKYDRLLEEIAGGLGLKKSSVSKAFVRGSQRMLEEINGRDLSKDQWVAILIDAIECGDRVVTVALGINTKGRKHFLGLREGSTENAEICKDLLQSMIERGFCWDQPLLFVIDGSKALYKAIRAIFGNEMPIQRCIRHKERNLLGYLPKNYHGELRRRWKRICASSADWNLTGPIC